MIDYLMTPCGIISAELHSLCERYKAIALTIDKKTLTIAMANNANDELLTALRFACGRKIKVEHWPEAKIEQTLRQWLPRGQVRASESSVDATYFSDTAEKLPPETEPLVLKSHISPRDFSTDEETSLNKESDTPVIQFINQTLRIAIQKRASDIHFEPYQHHYRVRLRIDGVLQETNSPTDELIPRISACLKVMAQLNIAERRLPQDGQFALQMDNLRYSMRIAILPTQYGEKIVLRILHSQQQPDLEQLGMTNDAREKLIQVLSSPQGLILVTGPTGSGKTVTLYSSLLQLDHEQKNICSVEDPVEIPVEGINQSQTNNRIGLDFSRILRTLLRQDPDVIMIGEIRDNETAEIAVKAAQTGHLVLSTLHTNSTADTLTRLMQMDVPGYLLASCLKLVIAQRLVRRLCLRCKQPAAPMYYPANIWPTPLDNWLAIGCEHCCAGYYGRIGVYEMLTVTREIRQALVQQFDPSQLAEIAQQQGNITLLTAGLTLVDQGITTIKEINRVVDILPQWRPINEFPSLI